MQLLPATLFDAFANSVCLLNYGGRFQALDGIIYYYNAG